MKKNSACLFMRTFVFVSCVRNSLLREVEVAWVRNCEAFSISMQATFFLLVKSITSGPSSMAALAFRLGL